MGEIKFITGLVMATLFAIAIVSYMVNFAADNSVAVSLADDAELGALSSNLQGEVQNFRVDANGSSAAFYDSEITAGDETTRTGGQFKVGLGTMMNATRGIFSSANTNIFGNDAGFGVVFTALFSLLIYIGIRYIWKTWKGGNPD